MTILSSDIKLRASERMTDTTDGGGRRTLNLIADGVAGNIFPKVSRVDSVYGRVNLRKVYGHVDTAGIDTYAGAHIIITDAPDNNRIHVTAFSTASEYDTRTTARDRIESYVIAGPESRMVLYGRQLVGSQALLAYQRGEEPLPEIGEVYAVSTEINGVTSAQQFVRIQDVAHEVRTFTDLLNNNLTQYTYRVLTMTIGAPLRYEFNGPATPTATSGAGTVSGRLRSTTVADASRYFGIQPLAEAGGIGDLTVRVGSVYTPIVPTTQRETSLSLASVTGALTQPYSNRFANTTEITMTNTESRLICFGKAIKRGSVLARRAAYYEFKADDGNGNLQIDGSPTQKWNFKIDYDAGILTASPGGTSGFDTAQIQIGCLTFELSVETAQAAHTRAIEVTLVTRGTVYTPVLNPLPAPESLIVDYRALGKWYRLRDDGTGELTGGDAAYGTGTVNYTTGGVIITLGALPDVGSSVLLSWGSQVHYEVKTTDAGSSAFQDFELANLPVKPNSFSFTYLSNGVTYTVSDDATGALTGGGATGTVNYTTGEVHVEYATRLPDFDSLLSVAYTSTEIDPAQPNPPPDGTTLVTARTEASTAALLFDMPSGFHPAGFNARVAVTFVDTSGTIFDATLNVFALTDGTLRGYAYVNGSLYVNPTTIGTVNYATGVIDIAATTVSGFVSRYDTSLNRWTNGEQCTLTLTGRAGSVNYFYYQPLLTNGIGGTLLTIDTLRTASLSVEDDTNIHIDLTRTSTSGIVAGSLLFSAAGKSYIDRSGTLYTDVSQSTGSGTAAGSINYDTGVATLSLWTRGATLALSVQSCLTKFGEWIAVEAFFRTAGSPLRPASLFVQVTADDGTLITGLADQDGIITGPYMRGEVEQTMGVVWVQFGQMITAAGNELEDWYDVANVVGANVWKPKRVQPATLRYSAVVLSNLPLNADILGLDPVRLPSDGRVPIYRPADVVVVHNTLSYNAGTPTASQVLAMGRTNLAALWLEDANKLKLSTTLYAADLDAGTVTMAADLNLAGYVTPIAAKHRIEEMGLLGDVQINGQITLTAPLLRAYPLGSFVSSALLFGDLFARVTGVFDQNTWTGVWSNALIGSQATGQYNDVDYPIAVLNSAAVSDRWRINFTGTTAFQVISENMGVIATGTTTVDLAPVNPLTGVPYFTLQSEGWGVSGSWAAGNQLRFNTVGAVAPVWLARTVLPGATLAGDSFDAQLRGDVD